MRHTGSTFAIARANRTRKYDEKLKPVIEELLSYGYGKVALSNALKAKGILTVTGIDYTAASVQALLKRLDIQPE